MTSPSTPRLPRPGPAAGRSSGAVLLEVVAALTLFFLAAGAVLVGLDQSIGGQRRLALEAEALNLAVTVRSELAKGEPLDLDAGEQPFDPPYDAWTWEIVTAPLGLGDLDPYLQSVEVIVRRADEGYTFRLVEWMPRETEADAAAEDLFFGEPL